MFITHYNPFTHSMLGLEQSLRDRKSPSWKWQAQLGPDLESVTWDLGMICVKKKIDVGLRRGGMREDRQRGSRHPFWRPVQRADSPQAVLQY